MNLTVTRMLELAPELPANVQKGHSFSEMNKLIILVPFCDVNFKVNLPKGTSKYQNQLGNHRERQKSKSK